MELTTLTKLLLVACAGGIAVLAVVIFVVSADLLSLGVDGWIVIIAILKPYTTSPHTISVFVCVDARSAPTTGRSRVDGFVVIIAVIGGWASRFFCEVSVFVVIYTFSWAGQITPLTIVVFVVTTDLSGARIDRLIIVVAVVWFWTLVVLGEVTVLVFVLTLYRAGLIPSDTIVIFAVATDLFCVGVDGFVVIIAIIWARASCAGDNKSVLVVVFATRSGFDIDLCPDLWTKFLSVVGELPDRFLKPKTCRCCHFDRKVLVLIRRDAIRGSQVDLLL